MASETNLEGSFSKAAENYQLCAGGTTQFVGQRLVPLMNIPPNATVLDNACGPGVMALEILKVHPDAQICAVDVAEPMLRLCKEVAVKAELEHKIKIETMNGMDLAGFKDDMFDASVTNFGIFFFPSPEKGAKEIYRTLKKGATAVVTVWMAVGNGPILAEAQKSIKPEKPFLGMPTFEKWKDPKTLEDCLKEGGFENVEVKEMDVVFSGLKEGRQSLLEAMLMNMKTLLGGSWSESEMSSLPAAVTRVLETSGGEWLVEIDDRKGIKCTAFVAVARK